MKQTAKTKISIVMTLAFLCLGLIYWEAVYAQDSHTAMQLIEVGLGLPKGWFRGFFFLYIIAGLFKTFLADATKPFREKINELVNAWLQSKINNMGGKNNE